jgi:hypothetical protein
MGTSTVSGPFRSENGFQQLDENGEWVPVAGGGGGGVTSIIAGSGISVSSPTGAVTISATGGGGGGAELVVVTRPSVPPPDPSDQLIQYIPTPTTPVIGQQWVVVLEPTYGKAEGGIIRLGFNTTWGGNYTFFGNVTDVWNTDQSLHNNFLYPSSGGDLTIVFDNRPGPDRAIAAQLSLVYMLDVLGYAFISVSGFKNIEGYTS